MIEKIKEHTHTNNFKFVLYQGKEVVVERTFNADVFNPIIRYSVDIRDTIVLDINRSDVSVCHLSRNCDRARCRWM